jgi:hypothetical protein
MTSKAVLRQMLSQEAHVRGVCVMMLMPRRLYSGTYERRMRHPMTLTSDDS